ncbi:hypothetical protein SARC_12247 [Sphaeroforma arctica JP610]|uniref:E3 ubiquitin-protein ligase listerin n=1 Tax=Sphaeroforma arctica JP610 TaxID=667725 RepID=A0A0L0FEQ2_9EUKA|nr:hypothetical protein SARC_12247 [Sphaeroforma arctica JP610]KNC75225.1 hypothetical protein SARC_12247 [Sphaeroforma arctica JP610]|eukprot:XP_014149127.1 hypothetical protein SARC_12247 [Sphaeroforma arctica JP610]
MSSHPCPPFLPLPLPRAQLLPTWPRCILNEAVADFIIAQTVDGADAPSLGLPLLTDTNITLPSSVCKYEDLMARTMALLGCEHLPTQLAVYLLLDRQVETDLATLHTHQLETLMSSQDDLSVVEEVDTSNPIAPRQALLDFLQTHSPIATSHSRSTTPSNAPTPPETQGSPRTQPGTDRKGGDVRDLLKSVSSRHLTSPPPETQGSPRTQPGTDRKGGDVRDLLKSVSSRHLTSPPPETVGSRRGTTPTPGTKASAHAHTHTQLQGYTATPQASPWTSAGGSYLLGWLLMLRYVDSASPAVRVGYAEALRVSGEVTTLLNAVAELLPYHVTRNANAIATHAAKLRDFDVCNLRRSDRGSAKINRTYGTAPDKTQSTHTHHTHHTHAQHTHTPSPQPQPQPTHTNATDGASVNGHSSSSGGVGSSSSIETSEVEGISLLAAHVYYQTLLHLPALARLWYNDLSRGARDRVDRYSQTVVSPMLIAQEISAAANASSSHLDLTLKASTVTKEVTAYYNLDEIALEVVIRLPANYPLGMVSVDSPSDMGIKSYRRWMLQMTTFLSSQNGSILDAVEMWKTNIDKRYDGVEECTVCYSVIHGSNYQLPKLRCRTCRKKFHSKCLYQWFQSSGGSTCPMCRSSFS